MDLKPADTRLGFNIGPNPNSKSVRPLSNERDLKRGVEQYVKIAQAKGVCTTFEIQVKHVYKVSSLRPKGQLENAADVPVSTFCFHTGLKA